MTEDAYQAQIRALWADANARLDVLIDYLVSQPPIKLARDEARAFTRWAMLTGANNRQVVIEHARRKELARTEGAKHAHHREETAE